MTDVHSRAVRSHNMRAIRNKNTKSELKLFELLEAAGFVFEVHASDLPGTPDVVMRDIQAAIFMNGCFWHGHDCHLFRLPDERREFWQPKIEKTRERDVRKWDALLALGWRVLIVWECAIKGKFRHTDDALIESIKTWITSNETSSQHKLHSLRCRPEDQTSLEG